MQPPPARRSISGSTPVAGMSSGSASGRALPARSTAAWSDGTGASSTGVPSGAGLPSSPITFGSQS